MLYLLSGLMSVEDVVADMRTLWRTFASSHLPVAFRCWYVASNTRQAFSKSFGEMVMKPCHIQTIAFVSERMPASQVHFCAYLIRRLGVSQGTATYIAE